LGGTGANAAATISLLGGRVELFAAVSNDVCGTWIRDQLADARIGTGHLRYVTGASPQSTIVLFNGKRCVLVDRGVADGVPIPALEDLEDVAAIYVSDPIASLGGLDVPAGVVLIVGVEYQMVKELSVASLMKADVIITNAAGWPLLSSLGIPVPILETRGSDGVRIHEGAGGMVDIPTEPVRTANATGAGDAFAGAFCWYYTRPMSLIDAVGRASLVGALAAATAGSHLTRLDAAEVERRWRARAPSAVHKRHPG
jgi:ribokinase